VQLGEAEREAADLRDELEDFRNRDLAGGRGKRMREDEGAAVDPAEVERALREDGFVLHAQPVVELASGEVTQHELLLRMIGEDGGLLLPRAFLAVARRAKLLSRLDAWVVRRAIATIAEQERVGREVRLEVNLSGEPVHDPALVAAIERDVATTGIDPSRLVLEVSERSALADPDGARSLARELRVLGCGFALDDFGTSFGSFRFLKDMPVDYLKIDGDLVVSLAESRTAQLVVRALVDVARGTGANTIAVFASDQQTIDLLRELGVGYAQGHKVGRPRPIADALSALEQPRLRQVEAPSESPPAQLAGTRNLAK
jgi:EAL domain-containing protein (putative c-di-GMP-specific phosphodiesterase class I)